jgi:hypothetical protein
MPLFRCTECGCVENTACSHYAVRERGEPALCSECDPAIGKWHGLFEKGSAEGYLVGNDGFLYSKEELDGGHLDWRKKHQGFKIVGEVTADGVK